MNKEEFKNQFMGMGALKDLKDNRDFKIASIQAPVDLPSGYILEDKFPVKNQNGYGSCTAQATAGHKQHQEKVEVSARYLYAKSKAEDNYSGQGTYTRIAFKILCDKGVPEEKLFPEEHESYEKYIDLSLVSKEAEDNASTHKSQSYWRVGVVNPDEIRQTIYQQKVPVVLTVPWYPNYNRPDANGYLPEPEGNGEGHALECLGWKDGWYRIKNSWGSGWGDGGFCWFREDYPKWDAWCSLDMPQDLPVDNYYGGKRTWDGYLREKSLGLNPWLLGKIKRLPNRREIIALAYGYHNFSTVFEGKNGKVWLEKTKPQLIKEGFDYKI